ncbi:hypothetical protein [Bremerella alba]|uniref:Uncharacterized protein n=1 Tax=Bremerella alba TaxID=980252 RepID=A0A7V8V1P2_9BACT|nr:hypothetical protein [Bremerella alba]MBA2113251.1 hypothetical protein [Bremerella alba]
MENSNQTNESNNQTAEATGQGSPSTSSPGRLGGWVKNTAYGFAGLTVLALVITVVSPEVAVAVTQYLPKEYQETLFASSASSEACSAGMSVGVSSGCCPSTVASCCSAGTSCGAPSASSEIADDAFAVAIPSLSLDDMLAGLSDD